MTNRRKIVVDDVEYTWQVGRQCVEIRGPEKYKRLVPKDEATGFYYDTRAFEKRYARITPGMISEWIKKDKKVSENGIREASS
jgi:hypothetical protein